ncbi:MAG: leucine-rich repeat domain-containing protein, partial [Alphaproteobacteria bacterium]|nr:leucine-rich repeat domain-containing protein [Alphaproteobacteria bacterium]
MKKRILILGLMMALNANAEELPSCGENCTYSYVENGVDNDNNPTYTLTISPIDVTKPAKIKDYERWNEPGVGYRTDAPWWGDTSITKVDVESGITTVGRAAFANTSIKEITLPEGLLSIGSQSLHRSEITSITIPDSVTEIGDWAFATKTLTQVNGNMENVTSIKYMTFADTALTDFVIPPAVTSVAFESFGDLEGYENYKLKNLTNLYCPESLMSECAAAIAYRGDDAEVKSYAFDGGVYVIGDDYYLSGDDMKKGDTASSAEEKAQYVCTLSLKDCKKQALINRGICQGADCDALAENDGKYMLKFGGRTYQSINDLLKGNYDVRRIYTVEEASFVSGKKNTV